MQLSESTLFSQVSVSVALLLSYKVTFGLGVIKFMVTHDDF